MDTKKWKVVGQAVVEDIHKEHGKTVWFVRCYCGHRNMFYRWSWAGHGVAICKGCGNRILYKTLEIETSVDKE